MWSRRRQRIYTPPVRLNLTVSGGRSGQQLEAAVWFRRQAAPGWSRRIP